MITNEFGMYPNKREIELPESNKLLWNLGKALIGNATINCGDCKKPIPLTLYVLEDAARTGSTHLCDNCHRMLIDQLNKEVEP